MSRATAQEKVRRDAAIIADRARGLRWATIAQRHGVSERQCRTVWKEERPAWRSDFSDGPEDIIFAAIASIDAVIEELALLAEQTPNDAVRLGAIKARMQAMDHRLGVMQAIGVLPPSEAALRFDLDGRAVARSILDVLEKHGVDPVVREDMLDAVGTATWPSSAETASSTNGSGS